MKIHNAVVFVTGANRGLGLAFARELLARGAKKVYAAARDPATITLPGVVPIKLDVTDATAVTAAAQACGDVTLLINNAGVADFGGFLADNSVVVARKAFETNYFGPLLLSQAFAPALKANGGGAIVNVLSVASWIASPFLGVYASSKSAAWALTNSLRQELQAQGTQVLGLHVGFMDTDMTKSIDMPKADPADVVRATLDGLEAGLSEVLADDVTRYVKQGLSAQPGVYLQALDR